MISSSFAGFVANNEAGNSLINDVRAILKGKNVVVRTYGRNKNRKQFAKTKSQIRILRQNLPVKHATYYGVYIYKNHKKVDKINPIEINNAKIVFDTVKKIYELNGVKTTL